MVESREMTIVNQAPGPHRHGLDALLIDTATPEHVPYLQRLKAQVMADRYRPAPDEAGFASWEDVYCTPDYFLAMMDDPNTLLLCIGSLREPVGMVVLRRSPEFVEIDDLLVLHPRQGDGTRLLTACLRYAEAWRSPKVVIDVYPGHEGVEAFLESHGFSYFEQNSNDLGRPMHRFHRTIADVL
jgi:GNAT superfamily N-acetyltransferase